MNLTLRITEVCAGGEHVTVTVTGDASMTARLSVAEIREPLSAEDKETFVRVLLRAYAQGKTKAQVKAGLQAGVVVTL